MNIQRKLEILSSSARYDVSCASSGVKRRDKGGLGTTTQSGICHSFTPDGRCISLLKILLTNYCIYDCKYCANRRSSNTARARFSAEEAAKLTCEFYKRNYIEGLFLSSGIIKNADYTLEQLVRAAKLLRIEHDFNGYIHLKLIPGASPELVLEAGKWADRLSANIELPTSEDLQVLAPEKNHPVIENTMGRVKQKIDEAEDNTKSRKRFPKRKLFAPAGQSTQMIIGATKSPDKTILKKAGELYNSHTLKRVYYSAFSPVPESAPLLPRAQTPLIREHRLYQADWLFRYYSFSLEELTSEEEPNLDLSLDPKLSWALKHRGLFPIDLNTAPRERLLRVPGLGCRSVERLLKTRKHRSIRFEDLKRLRMPLNRAKYFINTSDYNSHLHLLDSTTLPMLFRPTGTQLSLFEDVSSSITGEL